MTPSNGISSNGISSNCISGVDPGSLRPGSTIDVETKTRHYHIECLGGETIRISGHPEYCPQPVPAHVVGPIARGTHLTFLLNDLRPITTSRVIGLHVDEPGDPKTALISSSRVN
jgi:hypothetical protein